MYVNHGLFRLMQDELRQFVDKQGFGGFLPAVKQVGNVASLPGIVGRSIGLPDIHSGYGFAIGNVAAFDMSHPEAVVSPGGVGFDINCGVRLLRTNLMAEDVVPIQEELAQELFNYIPVGVGSKGVIPTTMPDLEQALAMGVDWSLREGYAWPEDKEHCFHPLTRVMRDNGTSCAIRDIKVGDALMGDDGSPRIVERMQRGQDIMYRISYGLDETMATHDMVGFSCFECSELHQLVIAVPTNASIEPILTVGGDEAGQDVTGYTVTYVDMVRWREWTCDAPGDVSVDFMIECDAVPGDGAEERRKAELACHQFIEGLPPFLLWEPPVALFVAYAARCPSFVSSCKMVRKAVHPNDPSSSLGSWLVARGCTVPVCDVAWALGRQLVSKDTACTSDLQCQVLNMLHESISGAKWATRLRTMLLCAAPAVRAAFLGGVTGVTPPLDTSVWSLDALINTTTKDGWRVALSSDCTSREYGDAARCIAHVAASIGYRIGVDATDDGEAMVVVLRKPQQYTEGYAHNANADDVQLYPFKVSRLGEGPFVGVTVSGGSHRFLLDDCTVVHNCEEYGRMLTADPSCVSNRAKKRGLPQLGTLGAGNHYVEIQKVAEIFEPKTAAKMGLNKIGQVCVMIHCGSRGLGHQVATDALVEMDRSMQRDGIAVNDRQLACARISSPEGKRYLAGMAAAANYAWVNRQCITFCARQCFAKMFKRSPLDLDMHVVYDVSHNIAKIEEHLVSCDDVKTPDKKREAGSQGGRADATPEEVDACDGLSLAIPKGMQLKRLLVHRKGSTRAFPPHHPLIPVDYQSIGQPVLVGGTMGTCSYVLVGTQRGMQETFGSTCHGAGRAWSRAKSRRTLDYSEVLDKLKEQNIAIRVASPKLVMEEAPESYKDVTQVVQACHDAGISRKVVRLVPLAVIKG